MSRCSPFVVELCSGDRVVLEARASSRTARPNDYVISADEKSQLPALRRCHQGRPAGPGQLARVEFEYERGGTLAYMGGRQRVIAQRAAIDRPDDSGMAQRPPCAPPVHASWLNQIEIVFSIIQRKVIKPADFADLADLADRLCRFEDRYNQTARPHVPSTGASPVTTSPT